MIKVALGIPTCGPPTWGLLDSIWGLLQHQQGTQLMNIRPPRSLPIALARQCIAYDFINNTDFDYLWWVDQDCFFAPQTLDRLLSWDVPIVGALCMIRGRNAAIPMVFKGKGEGENYQIAAQETYKFAGKHFNCETNAPQVLGVPPPNALFEVDFTGCHCLLTKRAVYESMTTPYFSDIPGKEDRWFMLKAKAEGGFKSYVDMSVMAGHGSGAERSAGIYDFLSSYRFENDLEEAKRNDKK